ncbi:MAG: hypothetical protein ACO3ED_07655, partial [Ilumatobacteraceae bacterium]
MLIIDRGTASPLDEMFAHHNPHIMEIRGESVNMFALLRALPKIHLGAVAYLEAYIDFVKPKLILSRTDNNHTLWQLKRRPNVTYKVALIQNGWRLDNPNSVLRVQELNDYLVDVAFVFSSASISIFSRIFQASFIESGSLKANEIPKLLRPTKTRELAFISSYRKSKENNYLSGVESIKNFSRVVTALNLFVSIAGSETNEFGGQAEKDFFAQSLNGCNWEIRRKL